MSTPAINLLAPRPTSASLQILKPPAVAVILLTALPLAALGEEHEESTLFRVLGFTAYGASAGDVISTELALARPGTFEANPFQRHRFVRLSSHIALPIVTNSLSAHLYRRGKKKTALWLRIGLAVAYGYVTVHNLRERGSP